MRPHFSACTKFPRDFNINFNIKSPFFSKPLRGQQIHNGVLESELLEMPLSALPSCHFPIPQLVNTTCGMLFNDISKSRGTTSA
jgi:hypothetical protein